VVFDINAEDVTNNIRDGKCWDGTPNAKLAAFNNGIKADMKSSPAGKPNLYDGETNTPEQIRSKGRTSLKNRGKELLGLGAIATIMGLTNLASQGAETTRLLSDSDAMSRAKKAALIGDVCSLERALIGVSFPKESLYEQLLKINPIIAQGFFSSVQAQLARLKENLEAMERHLNEVHK
jgi:hypothetical protein